MERRELVEKAMAGDSNAFGVLYQETYPSMKYYALKLVKNERDAEDIVQESYLKAWKYKDSLKDYSKFDNWLSRIVANTATNYLKKMKPDLFTDISYENEDGETGDFEIEDVSTDTRPEMAYSQKETSEMVEMLLGCLDDEQRICVIMRYQGEQKIKEIAEQLGVSENTVKSRLRYANKKMNAEAEEMKKKGYRFYGLAPLPLLILLIKGEMKAFAATSAYTAATAASTATATTAASATAKAGFFSTVAGKITAAVAVIAITATAATVTAVSLNKNKTAAPVNTSEAQTVEATTEKKEEKVDIDKVVSAYADYLGTDYPDGNYSSEYTYVPSYVGYSFKFIFIDDDDMPELYVDGNMTAAAHFLLTCDNGKVKEIGKGILSYKEKSGLYEMTPMHFQTQENYNIFELKNGKSKQIHEGVVKYNGAADENGFTYLWDDNTVSGDEFKKLHKEAYDSDAATESEEYESFGAAVNALEKKLGNNVSEKTHELMHLYALKNIVNLHNRDAENRFRGTDREGWDMLDQFCFYDVDHDGMPELYCEKTHSDGEGHALRIYKEDGVYKSMGAAGVGFVILKADYCLLVGGDAEETFYCYNPLDKHEGYLIFDADPIAEWDGKKVSRETYLKNRDALCDVNDKVELKYYKSIDEAYKHYKN